MLFPFSVRAVPLLAALFVRFVCSSGRNCADAPVFSPSSLAVRYGAPASATCTVCRKDCHGTKLGLEVSLGEKKENGSTLRWEVDRMTEWDTSAMCFYNHRSDGQCVAVLPVTVYQPPENVSLVLVDDADPAAAVCGQYTLWCVIRNAAPVDRLAVTFYRGQTVLGRLTSNRTEKEPATETFALDVNRSRDDSGALIRCEAELQLGPGGPQPPLVVTSESITAPTNCLESISTRQPPTETTAKPGPDSGASHAFIHWFLLCSLPFLSVLN